MIELGLLILRLMEHATPDIEFWKLHSARVCSGDILQSKGHHLGRMQSTSSPCTVVMRFIGDKVALTILKSLKRLSEITKYDFCKFNVDLDATA